MLPLIQSALGSLTMGLGALSIQNGIMIVMGCVLLYLGIKKQYEPLLLVPIGFGAVLVNIPLSGLMGGRVLGIFMILESLTEIFPCLIFIGIGAMSDFAPLLENPKILLLGAAGSSGSSLRSCWHSFWASICLIP